MRLLMNIDDLQHQVLNYGAQRQVCFVHIYTFFSFCIHILLDQSYNLNNFF